MLAWGLRVVFLLFCAIAAAKAGTRVELNSTGSAAVGATINFTATLLDNDVLAKNGTYRFKWRDNSAVPHFAEYKVTTPISRWAVEYSKNTTKPAFYRVSVEVEKDYLVWINVATNHFDFQITETLGGELRFLQNGTLRRKEFVSTNMPVNHTVKLRPSDMAYVLQKATSVRTYWFQNCTYLGATNGLSYIAIYPEEHEYHEVEALVEASFEKLPEPTTTTTTTTTTSTTTTTTTTPKTTTPTTTTTTPKSTAPAAKREKRDAELRSVETLTPVAHANAALLGMNLTAALQAQNTTNSNLSATALLLNSDLHYAELPHAVTPLVKPKVPYICLNRTIIERDPQKSYGFFMRRMIAKAPVTNFTTSGKNWLQHGDLLSLEIKCKGSDTLEYCTLVYDAPYNATGNETCRSYYMLVECEFSYMRYFSSSKTVLFFIRNEVSELMTQVTINIYEAKRQSQLSVVVVPVSFTLVAVILVVFGVSYYIQSRNRFTVEVADFNFGETQSIDMEYKTFQQRLIDSLCDVLPIRRGFAQSSSDIGPEPDSPGGGGVDSNLRYNTMT